MYVYVYIWHRCVHTQRTYLAYKDCFYILYIHCLHLTFALFTVHMLPFVLFGVGSHALFGQWGLDYFDPSPAGGKRGIRYDLLTPAALPSACRGISTHMEAGDAFVWDSRTLHGATAGRCTAANGGNYSSRLARFAAYVCYSPRSSASAEVITQRHEALSSGTGFGHQAHHLHDHTMMRQPGTATGPQLTWDDLTATQRRLVG